MKNRVFDRCVMYHTYMKELAEISISNSCNVGNKRLKAPKVSFGHP